MCETININGRVWCDDHTDIYTGSIKSVKSLVGSQNHPNLSRFETTADCCDFMYLVCWSNDWGGTGLLAEITGNITIATGANQWQVFATGSDRDDSGTRPSATEINGFIKEANCNNKWVSPFVGQENSGTARPFNSISGFSAESNFIWYDSGKDTRSKFPAAPYVPFVGITPNISWNTSNPTHDEFLIFRLPVRTLSTESCVDCDCCTEDNCCSKCGDDIYTEEIAIKERALDKSKLINVRGNNNRRCRGPYSDESCSELDVPKIEPCFYIHWGDSQSDRIENHDTELLYITVCNPYKNVVFKGLTITKIGISPIVPNTPNGEPAMQIVPDKLIHIACLDGCTCASREFTLLTKGVKQDQYTLNVSFCIEDISLKNVSFDDVSFDLDVVAS